MKKFLLAFICLSAPVMAVFLMTSCYPKTGYSPNPYYQGTPVGPAPTPTNVPVTVLSVNLYQSTGNATNPAVQFSAQIELGSPVTDAGITLITPQGDVPAPYTGFYGEYQAQEGWVYQAGATYTVQIDWGGNLFSHSILLPGGVTIPLPLGSGPISWIANGNRNWVEIYEDSSPSTVTLGNVFAVSPPVNISAAFPVTGNYDIFVTCQQLDFVTLPGFPVTGIVVAQQAVQEILTK